MAAEVRAGGGPENVLLVHNANSPESTEIARFYAELRNIPKCNQLGIDWRGSRESIPVEKFRNDLLQPILQAIRERRISRQIDYVVYSSDFPWKIDLRADFQGVKLGRVATPYASLTGATYLFQFVKAKSSRLLALNTNWYALNRGNLAKCVDPGSVESRGFRAQRLWSPTGKPARRGKSGEKSIGLNYLLSTMLGVTTPERGNTANEIKRYLTRSVTADRIRSDGTFYFATHTGVRSQTRDACYEKVIAALRSLGANAEQVQGKTPRDTPDAMGLMLGTTKYDLKKSHVKLLPGAIGDNLTSFGGVFSPVTKQTPLSEMIRHGAAGASGTVWEPYALQSKFANPTLFLHYRRGCSLAEAYYQSVAAPYQLLIVGDPLCQPWALRPRFTVPEFRGDADGPETIVLKPQVASDSEVGVKSWDLFIDGRLIARTPPGLGFRINRTSLKPGPNEIRVVATSDQPIESQNRWIATIEAPRSLDSIPSKKAINESP